MMAYSVICLLALMLALFSVTADNNKIASIKEVTDRTLQQLHKRWAISDFPNFLRSVSMSQTSWEVLKVKYQVKILKALLQGTSSTDNKPKKEKFVVSFMGSSVTAGHDTKFNITFSELTRSVMQPSFAAAGIQLEVINGAMGNNPCLPYDACVRTFAGPEADIVHWEQSFNCFGNDPNKRVEFEQFIRQSMSLASRPVVVFTTSSTPNWPENDCQGKDTKEKPNKSENDEKLLKLLETDASKIPLQNKGDEHHWSALLSMFQAYKMAGIQMWHHVSILTRDRSVLTCASPPPPHPHPPTPHTHAILVSCLSPFSLILIFSSYLFSIFFLVHDMYLNHRISHRTIIKITNVRVLTYQNGVVVLHLGIQANWVMNFEQRIIPIFGY